MTLPIRINEILNDQVVEWERKEFKESWDSIPIMHTICAFANDFHNWGGGYIIIGIKEKNGVPQLPPAGLEPSDVLKIQDELLNLCSRIKPNYFPVVEFLEFMNKLILILWVFGGEDRPFSAPESLSKGSPRNHYIRIFNHTVIARSSEELELIDISANIPFDDRINHHYKLEDIDLISVTEFLKKTKSELYRYADDIKFKSILSKLRIVGGPEENLKPRNIGLIFFSNNPEKVFPKSNIEIVEFPESPGGDIIGEKIFSGPIHHQIYQALNYLKNKVLKQYILKNSETAESEVIYNYPFPALEEAIVNAFFHRSYELREPIELRVYIDKIEIISYPGPDPCITLKALQSGNVIARRYRNRRIGEFLKELRLTEGRGTGLPKMFKAMKDIGSEPPLIKVDKERSYFIITFKINPRFAALEKAGAQKEPSKNPASTQQVSRKYSESIPYFREVLEFCKIERSREEIQIHIGCEDREYLRSVIITPILNDDFLQITFPGKPHSSKQKYVTTAKGKEVLNKIIE